MTASCSGKRFLALSNDLRHDEYVCSDARAIVLLQVACGCEHTMILLSNGTLYGAGKNQNGQLGFSNDFDHNEYWQQEEYTEQLFYLEFMRVFMPDDEAEQVRVQTPDVETEQVRMRMPCDARASAVRQFR